MLTNSFIENSINLNSHVTIPKATSPILDEPMIPINQNNEDENNSSNLVQDDELESNTEVEWPLNFVFPKELVGPNLSKIVQDSSLQIRKAELNELVKIVFNKMRSFDL